MKDKIEKKCEFCNNTGVTKFLPLSILYTLKK